MPLPPNRPHGSPRAAHPLVRLGTRRTGAAPAGSECLLILSRGWQQTQASATRLAILLGLVLGIGPTPLAAPTPNGPDPSSPPGLGLELERVAPGSADFTYLWWANGWLDGQPREPALLCLETGHYAAVLDVGRATFTRLGPVRRGPDYRETIDGDPARADQIHTQPGAELTLTAQIGDQRYRCTQAATNRQDWMNFPVRLIEGGRWLQRFDLLQLAFKDAAGRTLGATGRLEVVAWPDSLHLLLELTAPATLTDEIVLGLQLTGDGVPAPLPAVRHSASESSGMRIWRAALRVPFGPGTVAAAATEPVEATNSMVPLRVIDPGDNDASLPVAYDPDRGWHRVVLPARQWSVAKEPDRLERFRVTLTNDLPVERIVRILFDDPSGSPGITGVNALWRDPDGHPTGVPIQLSKNWHRQADRRLLYEGPWLHAFAFLRLPPRSRIDAELALTWARWGGIPAASHAQLCLIGWGWNQLWDQAAIGSWGESICYEPDAIQQRCRIDDVRPLMVWGMGEGQRRWTWTHNVGGGDFLMYVDAAGRYQPWRAVRTAYGSQGPNLTDVRYAGVTADGAIACRVRVSTPRTDDLHRAHHHLRYDVLKPTSFQRLAFYQVGSDRYHWHQYGRLARGNREGLLEEWTPGRGGKRYLRSGIPCEGEAPWFSLHEGLAEDNLKPVEGAWATRGLVIRSWRARLGGRDTAPFAAVFGTEAGGIPSANLELSAPPGLTELEPGDFVEAEVELVILPMVAGDYYGPNANLRAALATEANTWRAVHRQAAGNHLEVEVQRGRLAEDYPLVMAVDRQQRAEFNVTGGLGHVPVTFTGLRRPRGFRLGFGEADPSEPRADAAWWKAGTEYAQAEYEPASRTWRMTFNLPLDTPGDARVRRRVVFEPDPMENRDAPDGAAALRPPARPLPDHPGNVFVVGEDVLVPVPGDLAPSATGWRLLDDRQREVRRGELSPSPAVRPTAVAFGPLDPGWYRLEFGPTNTHRPSFTTLAVLPRLVTPPSPDTPVALDAAMSWFAAGDDLQQRRFANLAALTGVAWVRDRLRWRDLQPQAGPLVAGPTTYDNAAEAQRAAGLEVLQVFHDTPPWARETPGAGGRFAPDLRTVHDFARQLAIRFHGRVGAWEPWNEANVSAFGGHTVDQMCSWQKAAWLGLKAGDPDVLVGWNATAAVPTAAHTEGVLANETWPYFDTYNIHTYDWAHGYTELWEPARRAAAGRPIWITEADRGTPHLKDPPWFDQDPRLERLKAEWIAQAYAASLYAGAQRHFHFILGHYQEPNGVQFGLLRLDLTPRPAYVALAAVGRCLAGARSLGRWRPGSDVQVHAFRARPDGIERDVLVAWAEKEVDWDGRGVTTAEWRLPDALAAEEVVDYLGRSLGTALPAPLTSAPVFVFLPPGQAASLPLETPPALAPLRPGQASPVVLQVTLPRSAVRRVEDLPWSEGYAYQTAPGHPLEFTLHAYNFATNHAVGRLQVVRHPPDWEVTLTGPDFELEPGSRVARTGTLRIPDTGGTGDGWVVLRSDCGPHGHPVLAFRVVTPP